MNPRPKDIALLSSMLSGDNVVSYDLPHDDIPHNDEEEHLKKAFELFNNLSLQLADSYQMLEKRVVDLTEELDVVSEQRFAELQEKERLANRLENLINFLPGGVVVLDQKGIVVDSNPTAVAMLDNNLKGQLWRDIILRCFSPRSDDGHEVSNIKGQRISISTRSLAQDGQIILLTDQTGTRQLQAELSRHERLSALGKMVSTLAHQVRTPLSSAMLYANHLLHESLPIAQQQQFAQKLANRLNEMERQVRDMLLFVKGDVPLNDLATIADLHDQLSELTEALFQTTDIKCRWKISDKSLLIRCNKDALMGALLNLINNSVEAMQVDTKAACLQISLGRKNARQLSIIIDDSGPGIPQDIEQKINEMFYTTKSQGTGIGLSVVNTVTTSHGGQFTLQSIPGSGVRATLDLPIYQPRVDAILDHPSIAPEE